MIYQFTKKYLKIFFSSYENLLKSSSDFTMMAQAFWRNTQSAIQP